MTTPLCPYFGKCGGCSAQHIDYSLQIENKKKIVMRATGCEDIKVFSGPEYNYRNRMDFIFHPKGLGLREKGKWHNIIDIKECAIANSNINLMVKEIREYFKEIDAYDLRKQTGTFKQVVIRAPQEDSSISFVLNSKSTRLGEAIEKIREFCSHSMAKNIIVTYVSPQSEVSISEEYFILKGKDSLSQSFLGKTFNYSVQGFFQNNTAMAENMIEYTYDLLKGYNNIKLENIKGNTNESYLLDIYGGVGTFGIVNSTLFKEVTIIESFKGSVEAANRNIQINKIGNAKALVLDAKQVYKANLGRPLYVITDPPRSGMEQKAIIRIKELKPKVIIYISCNPKQLEKDLQKFREFEIRSAAIFDMFPQTPHIEAIVEMVRR